MDARCDLLELIERTCYKPYKLPFIHLYLEYVKEGTDGRCGERSGRVTFMVICQQSVEYDLYA
jgi:hypothetical protein